MRNGGASVRLAIGGARRQLTLGLWEILDATGDCRFSNRLCRNGRTLLLISVRRQQPNDQTQRLHFLADSRQLFFLLPQHIVNVFHSSPRIASD